MEKNNFFVKLTSLKMKIEIKKATIKDLETCLDLGDELFNYHQQNYSTANYAPVKNIRSIRRKYFKKCFKNTNYAFFLAKVDKTAVGMIIVKLEKIPPVFKFPLRGMVSEFIVSKNY